MTLLALLLLAAPADLEFARVNDHGAEEWVRAKDRAIVIRVPGGLYAKRPYEGDGTTRDPEPVDVASFFIDKHEVTNAQFAEFLNHAEDDARFVAAGVPGLESRDGKWLPQPGMERMPVTAATGHGALAYAEWVGGRLPTPDEWEKAAGGPEGRIYPWGDAEPDARFANFGSRGLQPVGAHPAGASFFGCLDMAGNAYERVVIGRGPVMIKGGSWLSPHPLNLRVLDLCMQPADVAERSVGFRCVMDDPEPERAPRAADAPAKLKLARSWAEAVERARKERKPVFLALLYDTCGQSDRTRAQLFSDPRFVAYCNEHMVVAVGQQPGHAMDRPHPPREDGSCPLYDGLTCREHETIFARGREVVLGFVVSPACFVLHPDRCEKGAGEAAVLVPELDLPKWGHAVDAYLDAFARARAAMAE